jgi:hypothetical protein
MEKKYHRTWKDVLQDAIMIVLGLAVLAFMLFAMGQSILGVASR